MRKFVRRKKSFMPTSFCRHATPTKHAMLRCPNRISESKSHISIATISKPQRLKSQSANETATKIVFNKERKIICGLRVGTRGLEPPQGASRKTGPLRGL